MLPEVSMKKSGQLFNSCILIFISCSFLFVISCGSKKQSKKDPISINVEDAVTQQILNIRSKRNADGKVNLEAIKTFLTVDNPTHRYIAALSLASVQDSNAVEALSDALMDPYDEVRRAAAFALGQTKSVLAAKNLADAFRNDSVRTVQATILEAVGRCGTAQELKSLCVSQPYPIQDSLLQEGLALALYRFALRKMVQPEGTERIMKDFISNSLMPKKARFTAANYLARVPDLDLGKYENILINNVQEETDPDILMFMVIGLAKTKKINALKTLINTFETHKDYRIRCQIIRGLHHFPYDSCHALIKDALYDTSLQVRVCAADFLNAYGKSAETITYFEWAEKHPHWFIKTKLMAAAIKNTEIFRGPTKAFYSTKLSERYLKSKNDYERAEILTALSNYSWNYKFISDAIFAKSDTVVISPVVKSSAASALVSLYSNPNFEKDMNFSTPRIREEIQQTFKKCIESGDAGVIAVVAEAIANEKNELKAAFSDFSFLKEAQKKLTIPRELETYIYLQQAIDYLSGSTQSDKTKYKANFVEIDWHFINALGPKPKVAIQTTKGRIVIELFPKEAPATVMQFVQLIKKGFYDGKFFHRVVPNFVAQTGCPRGDGWGGFDVSVVTEISPLRYNESGRVGMASAGKDTESAQFFITHAPAIHLDGNYTLFAQVTEGMDVVHRLEIGDKMQKVELIR